MHTFQFKLVYIGYTPNTEDTATEDIQHFFNHLGNDFTDKNNSEVDYRSLINDALKRLNSVPLKESYLTLAKKVPIFMVTTMDGNRTEDSQRLQRQFNKFILALNATIEEALQKDTIRQYAFTKEMFEKIGNNNLKVTTNKQAASLTFSL